MRFKALDGWRGIAALMVALCHLEIVSRIVRVGDVRNAYLFVDLFFVLSGFVIAHSYGERLGTSGQFRGFMTARLLRLWPLHVVVLAAFVLVECGLWLAADAGAGEGHVPFAGETSLGTLVANVFLVQALGFTDQSWNFPSWSISVEFWTYGVFGLALLATARLRAATPLVFAALVAFAVAVLVLKSPHGILVAFDAGFPRCVYGFFVGASTYRLWRRFQPSLGMWQASGLETLVVLSVAAFVARVGVTDWSFAAPIVFAVVVYVFALEGGVVSRALKSEPAQFLGRVSYSVYLWQVFVIYNFVDRPVALLQRLLHRSFTVAAVDLLGQPVKLIAPGSEVAAATIVLAYLALLLAIGHFSQKHIEQGGRALLERLLAARRPLPINDGGAATRAAPSR